MVKDFLNEDVGERQDVGNGSVRKRLCDLRTKNMGREINFMSSFSWKIKDQYEACLSDQTSFFSQLEASFQLAKFSPGSLKGRSLIM